MSLAVTASSCPALCRASTTFIHAKRQEVDGRDKPGHDIGLEGDD